MNGNPPQPPSRFHAGRRSSRTSASFALVLILLMLVLLTAVILTFLSLAQTNRRLSSNNASSVRVELLAHAALDTTVADLLDEITRNSTNALGNTGTNLYYLPTTNLAVVPQRTGIDTNLFQYSIVKISRAGMPCWYDPVTPGGTNYGAIRSLTNTAYSSGSDQYSANGFRVATNRWLLPGFMGTNLPPAFTPPDWIILTQSGPVDTRVATPTIAALTSATNASYAVGRYAYIVYDVGGLVDITVAGSGLDQNTCGNRFRASQIPLSAIPGIDTLSNASNIVYWRDGNFMTNSSFLLSATNTFTTLQPGEQTFVNRQDLIKFQQNNPTWMSAGALQYLTVFSRSLNRPQFTVPSSVPVPSNLVSSITSTAVTPAVNYANPATFSNPPELFNVRQTSGDVLMKNRWPLDRLNYFNNGATNATAIYNYFGLQRSADGYTWTYRGDTNSPSIATLAQVATNNPPREPDFFEVLQAAILSGSLGQGGKCNPPYTLGGDASPDFQDGESVVETRYRDNDLTRHVFQIGANLIDQYDSDDFPTIIKHTVAGKFSNKDVTAIYPETLDGDVAGIENLPYLSSVLLRFYRLSQTYNQYANREGMGAWYHLQFWNPHQNAWQAGSSDTTTTPQTLRVVMTEGQSQFEYEMWHQDPTGPTTKPYVVDTTDFPSAPAGDLVTSPINYYSAYQASSANTPYQVQFSNAAGAFSDPQFLMPGQDNATSPVNTSYYSSLGMTNSCESYPTEGGTAKGQIGILASYELVPGYPHPTTLKLYFAKTQIANTTDNQNPGRYPTFEVQLQDANHNWHTYQRFADLGRSGGGFIGTVDGNYISNTSANPPTNTGLDTLYTAWANPTGSPASTGIYTKNFFTRLDPRGERFGLGGGGGGVNEPVQATADGQAIGCPDNDQLFFSDTLSTHSGITHIYPLARNLYQSTFSLTAPFMADRDGVVRPGDPNPAQSVDPLVRSSNTTPSAMDSPTGTTDATVLRKRPVILNRPFLSVGEMGYASRDLPWKSLDFSSTNSADAALLDYFTCEDPYGPDPAAGGWSSDKALQQTALLRGKVNLNTQQPVVLAALINGAMLDVNGTNTGVLPASETASQFLTNTATIGSLATNLAAYTQVTATDSASGVKPSATGMPLKTRGDLIKALAANAAMSTIAGSGSGSGYIKTEQEGVIRALSDLGDTETWNLMIDVIVQSGHYSPLATTPAAGNFIVDGERRYWLHVAIDRYTGQIVDSHLEAVDE